MDEDKEALDRNNGVWNTGNWKGSGSSAWRITTGAIKLMDDTLIDNINKIVGKNDILWHLGDFAFSKYDYYKRCKYYRDRINCNNVNIIWGNHDRANEIHDLFSLDYRVYHYLHPNQNTKIVLHHSAMAIWEDSHRGAWHFYGHSHSGAEPWLDLHMPGRRSIDVGVDNAYKILGEYRPFGLDELSQMMNPRSGFSMDHHIPTNSSAPRE